MTEYLAHLAGGIVPAMLAVLAAVVAFAGSGAESVERAAICVRTAFFAAGTSKTG